MLCDLGPDGLEPAFDIAIKWVIVATLIMRLMGFAFDGVPGDPVGGKAPARYRPPSAIYRSSPKSFQLDEKDAQSNAALRPRMVADIALPLEGPPPYCVRGSANSISDRRDRPFEDMQF